MLRLVHSTDPDFETQFSALENRRQSDRAMIDDAVGAIIGDVRKRGDAAVIEATERFDGYRLSSAQLVLSKDEIDAGPSALKSEDLAALETAARRIREYHEARVPESWEIENKGSKLGQVVRPLERVGIYVPGGSAPLASTTLMLALPARVAGVPELVMTSPGEKLHPAVVAAARLAEMKNLCRIGGAQAVAAMAYGTETIPRVDKIVGPGNAYVQSAKRQVFGDVAIDAEAGPSEVAIVADDSISPAWVAADLLAQAEHDPMASVLLVTPSEELARATVDELAKQLKTLPRETIARSALKDFSLVVITRDLDEAIDLANRYAAEHLQLLTEDADRLVTRIDHAGAIFVGPFSPVPLGDYVAGPSHVLPTGGTARFFSVVGVDDFLKRMSVVRFSGEGIQEVGPAAVRLAELEGLEGHARALRLRLKANQEE